MTLRDDNNNFMAIIQENWC